jgi:acetyl esterase/lipase
VRRLKVAKAGCRLLRKAFATVLRNEEYFIPRADGSSLRLCVYTPNEREARAPGLLWIHGGGYAIGVPEYDSFFIRRFMDSHGAVVVSPDYTLSLEKPYPAALEDCYSALLWLARHGEEFGMRSDQIFIGGDSAGGGLCAALALLARDRGEVNIAFQMPLYPMLDDRPTESSRDNNAPMWDTESNQIAWKLYLGELYNTENVPAYAAPGRATDYSGLPPTCTFVGGAEPFRDETVAYINRLNQANIPTFFQIYPGGFHGFDMV